MVITMSNMLPKGYYAVQADPDKYQAGIFTFKGVDYAVTPGENVFATVHEAAAMAVSQPEQVLTGLEGSVPAAPVLLFSAGKHSMDKFDFDKSLILLGQRAGVSPNLSPKAPGDMPERNPLRDAEGESLLTGSYWHGRVRIPNGAAADTVIFDGFSSLGVSFRDQRVSGEGTCLVAMRNIIQLSPCGYVLYQFSSIREDSGLDREVELTNIRAEDFDDFGYGTPFALVNARKLTMEGICYGGTEQNLGLTDMPQGFCNCQRNRERSEFLVKNCYFYGFRGLGGLATSAREITGRVFDLTVEDCVFSEASRPGESPLQPYLIDDNSLLTVKNCLFRDSRGNPGAAISVSGAGERTELTGNRFEGFGQVLYHCPPALTEAPDYLENRSADWVTETEDPHTVLGEGSQAPFFAVSDRLYEGRRAYYGDQHVHTNCGGTSDGATPMADWPAGMEEKGVDFAMVVDHRQMRGYFLPEWDEERFVIGTEPGTRLLDPNQLHYNQSEIHYNMLFPHKYGLAMVLANFPEFEFRGDELTGSFKYPKFTKARFAELTAYVQSIGGMMVHPHPKTMLASDDPMDYYFGEHTYLETIYGAPGTSATFKNYELWVALLAAGKHVYASSGSDSHGAVSNAALSTFYTKEKNGRAFFDQMKTGDYTVGEVGIQMCIDGSPMGSELCYREGMVLTLRVKDFMSRAWKPKTVYELRIVTDKGVAYRSRFNGKVEQAVAIYVKDRSFYRVEIFDMTHRVWLAHGNPIWLR